MVVTRETDLWEPIFLSRVNDLMMLFNYEIKMLLYKIFNFIVSFSVFL